MRDLGDELRTAEARYYAGQLAAIFLLGIIAGSFVGWLLWD
jgi:predicted lysophospholipase L1 biosynthesis ABC-type transport system permease subunit